MCTHLVHSHIAYDVTLSYCIELNSLSHSVKGGVCWMGCDRAVFIASVAEGDRGSSPDNSTVFSENSSLHRTDLSPAPNSLPTYS